MKKRILAVLAALSLATCLLCAAAFPATAAERDYAHVETEENGGVTLSVSYDDPAAGRPMTLHVSASGGSGRYKYYMSAPTYADADGSRESVMDPARMPGYTDVRDAADYEFMPMASGTYQLQFQVMDMEDTGLYLRKTVSVAVSDPDHPSVSSLVAAAVSRCNAETDGSEYQKALWLHDWLLDQLEYDNSLTWSSAESALCRGTGTCQAYQAAYAKLLTAAGIENEETRDTGDGHTWNAAKIEGTWCQIDCTWDDSSDTWYGFDQRHLYFGLSDELMAIAHGKWRDSDGSTYGVHETSLANNYFVRSGEARDWAEAYAPEIQRHLDAGETSFSVAATNTSDPESVSGIINGIVADQLSGMEWEAGARVELNASGRPSQFDLAANYHADVPVTPTLGSLQIAAHVQDFGWRDSVGAGEIAGTTGLSKRLEALRINASFDGLSEDEEKEAIVVQAWTDGDWRGEVQNGEIAGTVGEGKSIEAVKIRLSERLAESYSVWYRVHSADVGWLGWARDGEPAGTVGYGHDAQAVQVVILPNASGAPGSTDKPFMNHGDDAPRIALNAHVSSIGWQPTVYDGSVAGTTGKSLALESLKAGVDWFGHDSAVELRGHVAGIGWQDWNEGQCGTTGQSRALEAIQIRLTGEIADSYDIWYRVHSADYGWLGWSKNGTAAGTVGLGKRIEAVEVRLVVKGGTAPGSTDGSTRGTIDCIEAKAQSINGAILESQTGKSIIAGSESGPMLQGFSASLVNTQYAGSAIFYQGEWQYSGWGNAWSNANLCSNENAGEVLKAVRLKLSGDASSVYDLRYRVLDSTYGWSDWALNGGAAGCEHGASGITCIQVELVPKAGDAVLTQTDALIQEPDNAPRLISQAHIADAGWLAPIGDDEIVGQTGKSRSLQALRIGFEGIDGDVEVQAHVADIGWQGAVADGKMAGTTGQNKAIQAVRLKLTGEVSQNYDIYYSVHVATYGWLGWAKNGEDAGTVGLGKQAEAVRVMLVAKNGGAVPVSDSPACINAPSIAVEARVDGLGWQPAVGNGAIAGTTGRGLSLQALKTSADSVVGGGISCSVHMSNIGWKEWASSGVVAGVSEGTGTIEAIRFSLSGGLATYFDVWYRAHVANMGWLDWTSNGAVAGTTGYSSGIQAVQIKLIPKGSSAPGPAQTAYINGSFAQPFAAANAMQRRVVDRCYATPSPGGGLCAMWVSQVFNSASLGYAEYNACDYYWNDCQYSKPFPIKVGMIVAVPSHNHTSAGSIWGHVAVYIGDGKVMDNVGWIRTMSLNDWLSYYGTTYTPKWGWYRNIPLQ